MTALDPRDRLEEAVREALGKAYRYGIAAVVANEGTFLGYPKAAEGTAALMLTADAYAADEVTAALEIAAGVAGEDGAGGGTRLLKAREVAAIGRVSVTSVYRAIRAKELDAVRIGRAYRIRERDAQRYLSDSRKGATDA